jgi:hypothetical protein
MTNAIRSYCVASDIPLKKNTVEQSNKVELATTASLRPSSLQWEPSLLIHSPSHADGKTLLAQAIAKRVGCALVHTIRPATLLAMYGSHADAALESLLHAILVSAAISEKSSSSSGGVCIILDHLDTMLPPRLSGRSSAGDAATPIFTAIGKTTKNDMQLGCRIESLVEYLTYSFIVVLLSLTQLIKWKLLISETSPVLCNAVINIHSPSKILSTISQEPVVAF